VSEVVQSCDSYAIGKVAQNEPEVRVTFWATVSEVVQSCDKLRLWEICPK
jgi:hypothetical protein